MATIQQEEETNPNTQGQQPTTGGSGGAGGSGGQGQGGGASVAAPVSNVQQNAAPQQNQGYTDVGSYLDANQAGSAQLGNQISSNLTNTYNQTKGGIEQSANDLINNVNQGYTKGNDQLIQQVAANPNQAASDPNQVAAFQAQLNNQYTGPTSWGDYGTQQGKVAQAQQQGNLVNTPGGLNVLTQQLESPSASQGVNQLDTLLLGGSPGALGQVKAASDPFNTLNTYLDSQNQAGNAAINKGQTEAASTSANALNAFTGANGTLTNLNSTINQSTAKAQDRAKTIQAEAKGLLANPQGATIAEGDMPDVLKSLNMTPAQLLSLQEQANKAEYGHFVSGTNAGNGSAWTQGQKLDFSGGANFTDPTTAINNGTTATPEQYQQMAAIQKLLGGKNPNGNAINPALSSLAGTPFQSSNFDPNAAATAGTQFNAQAQQDAMNRANQIADRQQAEHEASKGGGFFDSLINNPMIQTGAKYFANPLLAVPDEQKLLGSRPS